VTPAIALDALETNAVPQLHGARTNKQEATEMPGPIHRVDYHAAATQQKPYRFESWVAQRSKSMTGNRAYSARMFTNETDIQFLPLGRSFDEKILRVVEEHAVLTANHGHPISPLWHKCRNGRDQKPAQRGVKQRETEPSEFPHPPNGGL
jgi:hypothetical protein